MLCSNQKIENEDSERYKKRLIGICRKGGLKAICKGEKEAEWRDVTGREKEGMILMAENMVILACIPWAGNQNKTEPRRGEKGGRKRGREGKKKGVKKWRGGKKNRC